MEEFLRWCNIPAGDKHRNPVRDAAVGCIHPAATTIFYSNLSNLSAADIHAGRWPWDFKRDCLAQEVDHRQTPPLTIDVYHRGIVDRGGLQSHRMSGCSGYYLLALQNLEFNVWAVALP
jgi:hypothetical protein